MKTSISQRAPSAWPVALRMALVAFVAAVGFILAGPTTDASAAPTPPDPTPSSPANQPSWWSKLSRNMLAGPTASAAPTPPPAAESPSGKPTFRDRLNWKMHELLSKDTLDPHDPNYLKKSIAQIGAKRIAILLAKDSFPGVKDAVVAAIEDGREFSQRKKQTLNGRKKSVTAAQNAIVTAKKMQSEAKTPQQKGQAEKTLREARDHYKKVSAELRATKETQPNNIPAQIKDLDRKIRKLENRAGDLERKASNPQQTMTRAERNRVQQQIDNTRAALSRTQDESDRLRSQDDEGDTGGTRPATTGPKTPPKGPSTSSMKMPEGPVASSIRPPKSGLKTPRWGRGRGTGLAEADRRRLQGPPDDDGDTGGTRTTPRDPKQPPRGPGSTNPTTTSTTSKGSKSATITGPTTTSKGNKGATVTRPTVTSKTGFRGSTGTNQMADAIAGVIADGISQDYAAHLDRRNEQLLEQARKDPALAKRIIDDYNEIKDNNEIEVLFRGFDTSKGFTQGATREVAPELIKSQKALDTAKAVADKSNADPFYQQAGTDCGGYDTCVTERTDRLRKQNAKAIADSTKKAKKSNADPYYQQARTDCGGYDTCVTERTDRLRKQNAKAIADSTKKAKKSNADPYYQQARTDCGGYDTCVTERTRKLREQATEDAAKSRTAKDTKHGNKQKHTETTKAKQPHKAASTDKKVTKVTNLRKPL